MFNNLEDFQKNFLIFPVCQKRFTNIGPDRLGHRPRVSNIFEPRKVNRATFFLVINSSS